MSNVKPLNERERAQHDRLHSKWAMGTASKKEMERCMDLTSRNEAWLRQQREGERQ